MRMFLRDKRFYLAVRLRSRDTGERAFYILKIPHSKVPRFVVLPPKDGNYYLKTLSK